MVYVVPLSLLLAYTWCNTRPQYHGMDWILPGLLTYPGLAIGLLWNATNATAVMAGIVVNALLLYLLGTLVGWVTGPKTPN